MKWFIRLTYHREMIIRIPFVLNSRIKYFSIFKTLNFTDWARSPLSLGIYFSVRGLLSDIYITNRYLIRLYQCYAIRYQIGTITTTQDIESSKIKKSKTGTSLVTMFTVLAFQSMILLSSWYYNTLIYN